MPFDFMKRKKDPAADAAAVPAAAGGRRRDPVRRVDRGLAAGRQDDGRGPAVGCPQQARAGRHRGRQLGAGRWLRAARARPGPQDRRSVRPGDHPGRQRLAARDERRREVRPPDPQGLVRGRARGAALPGRRDRLPVSGVGAGQPAPSLVGDVHPDRGCHARPWATLRSASRRRPPSSSTGSTCAAWNRSMRGQGSARRSSRGSRWVARPGRTAPDGSRGAGSGARRLLGP